MLLKKYVKNRRKAKILLLLMIIGLIVLTIIVLSTAQNGQIESLLDESIAARAYGSKVAAAAELAMHLKSPKENGHIVPEKYDEQKVKARVMQYKIDQLREQKQQRDIEPGDEHTTLDVVTQGVHIFYSAPVPWYKNKKTTQALGSAAGIVRDAPRNEATQQLLGALSSYTPLPKPVKVLNTAFYPALGLYKPTASLLAKHFENIRNCGIGVLILSYSGKVAEQALQRQILELVPNYNLSVAFELSVANNQSVDYLRQQLTTLKQLSRLPGFHSVYALKRAAWLPVIYISNAYKLSESLGHLLCATHTDSLRHALDAYFIGHIRLKAHADVMRRLCFDGFYSKLPSNGATFASTWKNWSYLKSFALTYKMLFVPTVGPGFAERNKFPRHGDIQRHRSNGRYYGVAWRTAILNHVGFINIASYNNWPEGSQIEEVAPRAGFLDYNPGTKTKYLDLTTHWVGNFLKTRQEAAAGVSQPSCYELLNNTLC